MFKMECLKLYAEQHDLKYSEACMQFDKGLITSYDLFEAYLTEEGIFGYTQSIITTFRSCFNLD